jgi:hypothetical protein
MVLELKNENRKKTIGLDREGNLKREIYYGGNLSFT